MKTLEREARNTPEALPNWGDEAALHRVNRAREE